MNNEFLCSMMMFEDFTRNAYNQNLMENIQGEENQNTLKNFYNGSDENQPTFIGNNFSYYNSINNVNHPKPVKPPSTFSCCTLIPTFQVYATGIIDDFDNSIQNENININKKELCPTKILAIYLNASKVSQIDEVISNIKNMCKIYSDLLIVVEVSVRMRRLESFREIMQHFISNLKMINIDVVKILDGDNLVFINNQKN